ncbi:MAG: AEC family transporter [Lachnospiraceae bacterium]|nr:AEC family transporter [Lachnospiraceae bacterium]
MLLLQQMIAFFIFMFIGYYMRKRQIVDDRGCSSISWIVANAANPALIISSALNAEEIFPVSDVLFFLGWGIAVYAFLLLFSFLIPVLLRVPRAQIGTYRNFTVFSNVGFMGYPLISAMLGSQAVLCASIFTMPFNFLLYTFCIQNFNRERSDGEGRKFRVRDFFSVGILASFIALALNFLRPELPRFVQTTITNLANLTAALSMITIGMFLARMDLKELFGDLRLLLMAALKMLVLPIAGILILRLFIQDEMLLTVAMIILATPVASMVAILAEQSGGDSSLATRGVALTTVLSVVTIPLVSVLLKM